MARRNGAMEIPKVGAMSYETANIYIFFGFNKLAMNWQTDVK